MDEPARPALPPPAKIHFHLILPVIYLVVVAAPLGWILALINVLKGTLDPAQRRWTQALVALVVLDTVVLLGGMGLLQQRQQVFGPGLQTNFESERPTGLQFPPDSGLTKLSGVAPGSLAATAGFQAGDEIVAIDGQGIEGLMDLYYLLLAGDSGTSRTLKVDRGGTLLELQLTPPGRSREKLGLFQTVPGQDLPSPLDAMLPFLPAALVGLAAWGWSRARQAPRLPIWRGVLAVLLLATLIGAGGIWAQGVATGGASAGGVLLSLLAQHLCLASLSCGLLLYQPPEGPTPPPQPAGPVVRQGIFYLLSGIPRVAVLVLAGQAFLFRSSGAGQDPLASLAQADLGGFGALLFLLPVVFLGPLGEELLFRGYLLPRLARQLGAVPALLLSSAVFALLHPHYSAQMLLIFFFGLILGWARLRSGGLKAPLLLHMGLNAFSAFMLLG